MLVDIANDLIKEQKQFANLKVNPDPQSPYQHIAFRVVNLSIYINLVEKLEDKKSTNWYDKENYYFYRGIDNSEYSLLPSISVNGLIEFEKYLVNDFYNMRPDEFSKGLSNFEKLAKMQHYGLPTRLLDFTLNPLVGLYFACKSSNLSNAKCDGRIVIMLSDFDINNTEDTIESICSIYKYDDGDLDDRTKAITYPLFQMHSFPKYMQTIYHDHPEGIVVRPPFITERERRQNSVFMLFPNNLIMHDHLIDDDEGGHLFQESYSEDWEHIVLGNTLKEIDETQLSQGFISVIIPHQYKNKILSQLDCVGINESFLFPELEYTARNLKEKYSSVKKNLDSYISK